MQLSLGIRTMSRCFAALALCLVLANCAARPDAAFTEAVLNSRDTFMAEQAPPKPNRAPVRRVAAGTTIGSSSATARSRTPSEEQQSVVDGQGEKAELDRLKQTTTICRC